MDIVDLYGLPLEEFTDARNELAARLKKEGKAEEAAEVKKLKKPGLAAWTVNQLARAHHKKLDELFVLRDEIETSSSAADLRSRTEERRKLLTGLVADARKVLVQGGHAPSAGTIEKVSQTLLAAGDEATRQSVLQGTLTSELTSSTATFGAFGSFDAATVTFDDEPDEPDPRVERLRAEAEEAERQADLLAEIASAAVEAAERARDDAGAARRDALKARERADRAEQKN